MRRMVSASLLTAAVAGGLVTLAPAPALADDNCPGVAVGGATVGVCESFAVTPTSNTGYTVAGDIEPYCGVPQSPVLCLILGINGIGIDATGADVNGSTPPLPTYDPATGQVSAPAGTYATVYADGTPVSVDTPAYCVTIDVRC